MRPINPWTYFGLGLLLCALPLASEAQTVKPLTPQSEPVLPIAEFEYERAHHVDAKEVSSLKQEAMKGSPEAAKKLADFFGVQQDWQNQAYWLSIAVENGDEEQRFNLARAYTRENDEYGEYRARYWYKKIISDGPKDMSELAKRELAAEEEYKKLYDHSDK